LNAEMGLSTKEFYLSFLQEPNLKARMDILKKYLKPKTREDLLLSLAVYTAIEGVVLYSSFAFLMSFQSTGMNKLSNVVTGLRYSTRDEFIHAEGTSWLFNET
ncbi:ribonucleotide-diphosphate reductase subunit beta, partial [Streptomyces sp. DH7]|uniref:ribonucleotide-diphosphate reductase subunit beta n=1 Tax=Streptomyces sp. DH7 TaxID=2857006 RepID=UPI001E3C0287